MISVVNDLIVEIEQLMNDIFNYETENGESEISRLLQATLHESLDYKKKWG